MSLQGHEKKTVVVGMSGGVDSSVAALLLKEQGYRVIGLFMKNWEEEQDGVCTAAEDYEDVASVCAKIGIPYYSVNFAAEYRAKVFDQFVADYKRGLTPNPDVFCNRHIKFSVFYDKARELGADYLATGHYARIVDGRLTKALDGTKDQSYFLQAVRPEGFKNVLFPLGEILKEDVRRIAHEAGLVTASKKDSTGICFIGERDFTRFLADYVPLQPGDFRQLDGTPVGRHRGACFYTLGQRRGLGLGGPGERWFVVDKDLKSRTVFVERGEHAALYCDELTARDVNVCSDTPLAWNDGKLRIKAKVRYRQPDQDCVVEDLGDGRVRVVFDEPQRAVAAGQSVAFYDGETCLGGAVIDAAGASYHARGLSSPH